MKPRLLTLVALVAAAAWSRTAGAQGFTLKTQLAASGVTGCASFPPLAAGAGNPTSDAQAQSLIADGEDAALQGEHTVARDAFLKAQALVPGNARLAYYLAREHEALAENTAAVQQYCRYLALSPDASDADDIRGRIVRLTPATELERLDNARANFQSGIALLRRKQYHAADSVFGAVAGAVPNAPEPLFNRALSRAARGDRQNAMLDFERYLELDPQASDRSAVRAAMSRLPEGVYGPGQAFFSGLFVPGMGQMSTGRPVLGVLALGAVGGAVALGWQQKSELVVDRYTDPFGNSYADSVTRVRRPQLALGLGAAAAVWFLSAIESSSYARRTRARAEAIISRDAGATDRPRVGAVIRALPRDRVGVGLSLR